MKTITITDADALKLAELVHENAEYRPDYFGSLATAVLWQLEEYMYCECPSCHAIGLPELFIRHKEVAMAQMGVVPPYREERWE